MTHVSATHDALARIEPAPSALTKLPSLDLIRRVHALLTTPDSRGQPWSRNSLAKVMGTSSAYVSTWLAQVDANGIPALNPPALVMNLTKFESQMEDLLLRIQERTTFVDDLFDTAFCKSFRSFVNWIRKVHGIGVYCSPGGHGKTSAIAHYCRAHPMALSICPNTAENGAADLLRLLFDEVNIAGRAPRGTRRFTWLCEKLTGSERVILVDMYQRLTLRGIDFLCDLHDRTQVPILCTGDETGLEKFRTSTQRSTRVFTVRHGPWGQDGRPVKLTATHLADIREAATHLVQREAPAHAAALLPLAHQVATAPWRSISAPCPNS